MGGLTGEQVEALEVARSFLEAVEKTAMTRSYKMLLLLGMIAQGKFPGSIELDELVEAFVHHANRSALLRNDVEIDLADEPRLRTKTIENPINAWAGPGAAGGAVYFELDGNAFRTTKLLPTTRRAEIADLTRELCEWRLAQYVERLLG